MSAPPAWLPADRRFLWDGPHDDAHERRVLRCLIMGEASLETPQGKLCVAMNPINRTRYTRQGIGWWSTDLITTILQRFQYTCFWDGWADRAGQRGRKHDIIAAFESTTANDRIFECARVASVALGGDEGDPSFGADHYFASYIAKPEWASRMEPTNRSGVHEFFNAQLWIG